MTRRSGEDMSRRPWHCWRCWARELRNLAAGVLWGWWLDWRASRSLCRKIGNRLNLAWFWWRCHYWPFFIDTGYSMDCPHGEQEVWA